MISPYLSIIDKVNEMKELSKPLRALLVGSHIRENRGKTWKIFLGEELRMKKKAADIKRDNFYPIKTFFSRYHFYSSTSSLR